MYVYIVDTNDTSDVAAAAGMMMMMINQKQHTDNTAVAATVIVTLLLVVMIWLRKNPFMLLLASWGVRKRPIYIFTK
jgi:hypothetical protein